MTEAARPILRGEAGITLRRDTIKQAPRTPQVKMLVSEEDAPLLSALKAKRRALAEAARVPAYVIFTDKTLIEMAETRPQTLDAMARISGVGASKLEKYGAGFLAVITGEVPASVHPARRKLAGREASTLYDQLLAVQADLSRGHDGTDKPMTCSSAQLAKVAAAKPADLPSLARVLGERHAERFGDAFLEVLRQAG
jgi:ATP-dependent DNA helicase RecQ